MKRRNFLKILAALALTPQFPRTAAGASATLLPRIWDDYKGRFIQTDGRVIELTAADRSTSEGQAYALFHSLVFDDQRNFARILQWSRDNLCGGDFSRRLPAWLWGRDEEGTWRVLDQNNASDADLTFIYCLRQAAQIWDAPHYHRLAAALQQQLLHNCSEELPGLGRILLPGAHGFRNDHGWRLNPSYLMLPMLRDLARAWPAQGWEDIELNSRSLLARCAGKAGYAADWLHWTHDGTCAIDGKHGAVGSYDAIRVYFWLAVTPDASLLLQRYPGMAARLAHQAIIPEQVDSHSGAAQGEAPVGFAAALLPYLKKMATDKVYQTQYQRVSEAVQEPAALHRLSYYDLNLILFGLGAAQSRYRFERDGTLQRTVTA